MLLPPLFSVFIRELAVSYSHLGLLMTLFFVVSGTGHALAGFLADRIGARPVLFTALACFFAASLAAASAQGHGGLMLAAALAGLGTGLAGPSRDMLIKRAAPPGDTGQVYGTVYSGLDVGFALAAPAFGRVLDHGQPPEVFAGAAALLMMGVLCPGLVGWRTRVTASVRSP